MTGRCSGCDRPFGTGRFQAVHADGGRCTACVQLDYSGTVPAHRTVQRDDDGTCMRPRWCNEPDGHPLPHRRYLHSILIGRSSVALTLERGEHGPRRPVLAAGNGAVVSIPLTWDQVGQLSDALTDAHARYAA